MGWAEDFEAFVGVADAGSISQAARDLGVPRATLSRQLARLEERLGVRLVHRSTRRLVLTAAGESLLPRARVAIRMTQAALNEVRRLDDVPRGRLRIATGPWETPAFGALIARFGLMNPEVTVEVSAETRHVDLVAEQFDVALRGGVVRDPQLTQRLLFRTDAIAVASPDYLAIHGVPSSPDDLEEHSCLCGFGGGSRPMTDWPLRDGGRVSVHGQLVTNDVQVLMGAVVNGLGIALLPRGLTQRTIDVGLLVPLLEGEVGEDTTISLLWQEREYMEPKVRAFVDLAVEWSSQQRLARRAGPPESAVG
ncbi:MAG: LysR family transcriptional regulator [Myxococcota bacterium]